MRDMKKMITWKNIKINVNENRYLYIKYRYTFDKSYCFAIKIYLFCLT